MIKTICAWCSKLITDGMTENGISHGICEACFDKEMAKFEDAKGISDATRI